MAERADELADDDLITAWGLVVEGHAAVTRALEADLAAHDLAPAWFEVLLRLVRSPDHRLPMTRLAGEISFSSGGFTKLADRLERAGLVAREACPTDRRVTWMVLTGDGHDRIEQVLAEHVDALRREVLAPLGPARLRALGESMRILRDAHAAPRGEDAHTTPPGEGD